MVKKIGGQIEMSTKKYWITFVEEYWEGQRPKVMCRIEVYEKPSKSQYASEEIHFCTDREETYYKFREKWDWRTISKKRLEKVRKIAKSFEQERLDKKRLDKTASK